MKNRIPSLRIFLALWITGTLAGAAFAQEEAAKWTVDDILLAEDAGDFQVSPDGKWAVWVKSRMDKDEGRRLSHLYLSSLAEEREVQLTRGKVADRNPRWSPDGKRIAFLSRRDQEDKNGETKTQIWLLDLPGGEPYPAAKFSRDVRDFEWLDANRIVFLAEEDPTLWEQEVKQRKDTSQVVEDEEHEPPVRLFVLDLKEKEIRRLTTNRDWIQALAASPDGQWVAAVHQRSLRFAYDHEITPSLNLVRVADGEVIPVEPERRMVPRQLEWTKDSKGLFYATEYSSHPKYFTATITILNYFDLDSRQARQVDLDWANGLGGYSRSIIATDDGFLALLADGVRFRPARYVRAGAEWRRRDLTGEPVRNIWDWNLGPDGKTLLYEYSTTTKPTQWYVASLDGTQVGSPRQLTKLNPSFEKKPKGRVEIIRWTGANGDEVEGILYYPFDYKEGEKYPLMLSIHGGPSGTDFDAWSESWASPKVLLRQKGAFVLKVNYHGSGNYGLEWVESICCGKYYELERVDIENGVDYLIEQGLVDPDRIGSMGWSNGAILTTELVTRNTERYKVASAGAGDVEWISDWANVMFGASFDNYYFGAAPYENPQLYIEKSPYFRLKDCKTPTIIFTGTEDVNVPPSQSWSHYRVLQQATETPVRLVLFPGEPHGLRKYQHQKRKVEEEMAWFDKHFFKAEQPENPAVKKGSPLQRLLALQGVSRVDGKYGTQSAGLLVPEIVSFKGLEVGRFEVTRAQFAQFDPDYPVPPGTENLPAGGITAEQAEAYVRWLSEQTGRRYRLPNAEEADKLYGDPGEAANTLDHWAGYAPNPEDTARLHEALAGLDATALLRPVGLSDVAGEEGSEVYDLGGNVAEWTLDAEGHPVLRGGSADLPARPKDDRRQAGEAFRGLRVVLETD
ncbi:MAG: prolyl oligopeptidase family serine peptidase [Acidobacteriota bacterium]